MPLAESVRVKLPAEPLRQPLIVWPDPLEVSVVWVVVVVVVLLLGLVDCDPEVLGLLDWSVLGLLELGLLDWSVLLGLLELGLVELDPELLG